MHEYLRLALLLGGLFTYMFIGAGLFHALEPGWTDWDPWDPEGNMTDFNITSTNDTLYNFEPRSYMEAFYYCASVITTIGYGHIYPVTHAAKFFTAVFANFGIPAFFYILAIIGRKFANLVEAGESRFFSRIPGPYGRRTVTLLLVELFGVIFLIVIPAAIISSVEGWTTGDAVWYLFVSLSTIGFGDLYGGYSESFFAFDAKFGIYVFCKFWYYIIGLSWVATMWCLLADVLPETEPKPDAELVSSEEPDRQGDLLPQQA